MTEVVISVFEDALRTQTTHKGGAKKLADSVNANKKLLDVVLFGMFDKVLVCTKKDASVDRIVNFFSLFAASLATNEDSFKIVLDYLVSRTKAENKAIRFRACETVANIFTKLPEGFEFSNEMWTFVCDNFTPLLRDKCVNVRAWSVKVLKLFQTVDNLLITKEFLRLLSSDPSSEVRATTVSAISIRTATLPEIVKRLEDISPDVRKAVLNKLMDPALTIKHIPIALRSKIVKNGLLDRDDGVSNLTSKLIMKWFQNEHNSMPKLLKMFDMYEHETEVTLVANAVLMELDNGKGYTNALKEGVMNDPIEWLQPEEELNGYFKKQSVEVFWAITRVEYARKMFSSQMCAEISENVLPSMSVLVKQLMKAKKNCLLNQNASGIALFRWLLRLTSLIESSDSDNNEQLIKICSLLLNDVTLPDPLVDDVLDCWSRCLFATKAIQNESQLVSSIIQNCQLLEKQDPFSISRDPVEDESEEDADRWVNAALAAITIRMLQQISWVLKRGAGGRVVEGNEHFTIMIPWIINAITHPSVDLRCLGARCLGLLSLSDAKYYCDHYELMNQVVSNVEEDEQVRGITLQALIDSIMVHSNNAADSLIKQKINNLTNVICRMFASSN